MEDSEYYAMMRRQYSNTVVIKKNKTSVKKASVETEPACHTPGTFNELTKKYGHKDAEMFMERNNEDDFPF